MFQKVLPASFWGFQLIKGAGEGSAAMKTAGSLPGPGLAPTSAPSYKPVPGDAMPSPDGRTRHTCCTDIFVHKHSHGLKKESMKKPVGKDEDIKDSVRLDLLSHTHQPSSSGIAVKHNLTKQSNLSS